MLQYFYKESSWLLSHDILSRNNIIILYLFANCFILLQYYLQPQFICCSADLMLSESAVLAFVVAFHASRTMSVLLQLCVERLRQASERRALTNYSLRLLRRTSEGVCMLAAMFPRYPSWNVRFYWACRYPFSKWDMHLCIIHWLGFVCASSAYRLLHLMCIEIIIVRPSWICIHDVSSVSRPSSARVRLILWHVHFASHVTCISSNDLSRASSALVLFCLLFSSLNRASAMDRPFALRSLVDRWWWWWWWWWSRFVSCSFRTWFDKGCYNSALPS